LFNNVSDLSVNSIFTVRRCTTFTKFPLALSGGNSENLAPVAGENEERTASKSCFGNASACTITFWPIAILRYWLSLQSATTHRSSLSTILHVDCTACNTC